MNFILSIFNFLGDSNVPKFDLRKKPTREDYAREINFFIQRNFPVLCFGSILFLLVVFVVVCFVVVGPIESGMLKNFLAGGV